MHLRALKSGIRLRLTRLRAYAQNFIICACVWAHEIRAKKHKHKFSKLYLK